MSMCAIGIKENGIYKMVLCKYGGDVSKNGLMLYNYYNTYEMAKKLTRLGHLHTIDKKIKPDKGELHYPHKPSKDVTIASHRDKHEKYLAPLNYKTLEELEWIDIVYYFDRELGKWFVDLTECKTYERVDHDGAPSTIVLKPWKQANLSKLVQFYNEERNEWFCKIENQRILSSLEDKLVEHNLI